MLRLSRRPGPPTRHRRARGAAWARHRASLATRPPRAEQVTDELVFNAKKTGALRAEGKPWYASVLFWWLVFAALAVLGADHDPANVPILIVPLLFFHFIFDTVFTLCRRLLAREDVTQAHRSHLYQLLNQAGQSHARVSTLHFAIALAQGGGAYVMLQLPAIHQWGVFLPFLVLETVYAVSVMKTARRRGLLD